MKLKYSILVITAGVFLFSACQKKETVSIIPAITYNSFVPYGLDSGIMEVNFTDGDGDIGYTGDAGSSGSDFFIEYLHDSLGHFVPLIITNQTGNTVVLNSYNIPSLTPTGNNKSIKGIIRINMEQWIPVVDTGTAPHQGFIQLIPAGDTLQFNIWVFDRAGHKSNVLTTPNIIVP